jgi:hypothetical protein
MTAAARASTSLAQVLRTPLQALRTAARRVLARSAGLTAVPSDGMQRLQISGGTAS